MAQCEYHLYDYRNALVHINQGLELEQSLDLLATKGIILAEDGILNNDFYKLKEAEKIFENLYNQSPTGVNAYNYANTLSALNQTEKAEEFYLIAVNLNPIIVRLGKIWGKFIINWGNIRKKYDAIIKP